MTVLGALLNIVKPASQMDEYSKALPWMIPRPPPVTDDIRPGHHSTLRWSLTPVINIWMDDYIVITRRTIFVQHISLRKATTFCCVAESRKWIWRTHPPSDRCPHAPTHVCVFFLIITPAATTYKLSSTPRAPS